MLALAAGLLALAGCGSSSNSTSSSSSAPASRPAPAATTTTTTAPATGAAQTLSVSANPEGLLKFVPSTLTAKAGKVTIDFSNPASVEHDLTVESPSHSTLGATPIFTGGKKAVTVNLTPGTYKFYCSVPGHRQAGMEGTLEVK